MKILSASLLLTLCLLPANRALPAQDTDTALPHIDRTGKHPALIVDGGPYLMLGV